MVSLPRPVFKHHGKGVHSTVTTSVDMRWYTGAQIGGTPTNPGLMLCQDNGKSCKTSQAADIEGSNSYETKEQNWDKNGVANFTGVSGYCHPAPLPSPGSDCHYIGTARTLSDLQKVGGQTFRCFAVVGKWCTAKPMTQPAPGVPYLISDLPVVGYDAVKNAQINCSDGSTTCDGWGSPTKPIAGELVVLGGSYSGNYAQFEVNDMDPNTCEQTHEPNPYGTFEGVVYVTNVPFGGNMGTQDAVVVDTWSDGGTHAERYFNVPLWGNVRASILSPNPTTGIVEKYTNLFHNWESRDLTILPFDPTDKSTDLSTRDDICPQGSLVLLHSV